MIDARSDGVWHGKVADATTAIGRINEDLNGPRNDLAAMTTPQASTQRQLRRRPHGRQALLATLVIVAAAVRPAGAQYPRDSTLYNQTLGAARDAVTLALRNAPVLEDVYYPAKYRLPIDFYVASSAAGAYVQNVVFDPCRQWGASCCNDTFGSPEFVAPPPAAAALGQSAAAAAAAATGSSSSSSAAGDELPRAGALRDDGSPLATEASRRPDDELRVDPRCTGPYTPRPDCVGLHLATRPFRLMPRCWNFNDSVVADRPCRAPGDGSPVRLCVELGVTQNAFVVECGGRYRAHPHCGTYVEVHRPGHAGVLGEARLPGMFTSGYRMTVISTTYKKSPNRVICYDPQLQGRYEVWWVQRTLYSLVLERRIPFRVVSPLCDWDADNNRYLPYATVDPDDGATRDDWTDGSIDGNGAGGVPLVGHDPYDERRFRLSRPRVAGDPLRGRPGRGMGARMVPPDPDTAAAAGGGDDVGDDGVSYTYTPAAPLETVRSGRLEPPNVPPDEARQRRLVR